MNKPLVVTVSQLNRKISLMIKGEKTFSDLYVKGEISNLTFHKSGHIYFSLKDDVYTLSAVMYNGNTHNLQFTPEIGMSVIVRGSVQGYEKGGTYQINVTEIIPDGVGAQATALKQLKKKLEDEGIFSQKRELPAFPEKICVITSETGAVIHDIITVMSRRYPIAEIILLPVLVQGENAPESIAKAFQKSGKTGADLIIFGRGGGSSEDLSAFNNEIVVRAVFNSSIPTISAVGHETDVTLSDFAADRRAPTPSAAAEIATPDLTQIVSFLDNKREQLKNRALSIIDYHNSKIDIAFNKINAKNPIHVISANEQRIDSKFNEISDKFNAIISHKEHLLSEKVSVIEALNPLSVLMRGYSIVYNNGKVVFSEKSVVAGDEIKIKLNDGEITAVVR